MKYSAFISVAALSSCSLAAISIGIHKGTHPKVSKRQLLKRATILEELANNFTGQSYMATVTVGTPGQDVALAIDTGSSDTWVLDSKADLCTDEEYQAEERTGCQTPFDSGDSSTFKVLRRNAFHITYGDGSGADGDYMTDAFSIGDVSIEDLTMGIAHNANLTQGLLGIGYSLNEASNSDDPSTRENEAFVYPNIIDEMVSQGLIELPAYSLYLNDLEAETGSILFGGLDTEKYQGNLVQMPIVPRQLRNGSEIYSEFGVAITSFAIGGKDIPMAETPSAILDSGTSLTYIPTSLASDIIRELDAYDDTDELCFSCTGLVLVDCALIGDSSKSFDFGFGGTDGSDSVTIKVQLDEMILEPRKLGFSLAGYIPSSITWDETCILGIIPSPEEPYILGDTFLRSAYVVYDLKNNVVAIAQTNFNSTDSNVIDFKADQTAIPAVSGVASGAGIVETNTGLSGGRPTTSRGSRPTSSPTENANGPITVTATPTGAAVASVPSFDLSGLFVMGGAALFAVLGGGLFLL